MTSKLCRRFTHILLFVSVHTLLLSPVLVLFCVHTTEGTMILEIFFKGRGEAAYQNKRRRGGRKKEIGIKELKNCINHLQFLCYARGEVDGDVYLTAYTLYILGERRTAIEISNLKTTPTMLRNAQTRLIRLERRGYPHLLRLYSTKKNKTTPPKPIISQEIPQLQKLYITDPISPGSTFFLPNGTKIFNKLVQFMKLQQQQLRFGYQEVITPLIYKKSLWERSGHWQNYQDDMFKVEVHDESKEVYGLKPMNCPGHCVIYKRFDHSYNELPLRYTDFSPLHRDEPSGALSGLTRVRKFHQDDGHIFCTREQVEGEILSCLKLIDLCYGKIFKFNPGGEAYSINLSTRPHDHFIGEIAEWDHAEDVLRRVLKMSGRKWQINEGDGAFYGPKLDIMVPDHTGKKHQVATIQLDFQLPQRFELKYKDRDNEYKTPIMIHRAVFGSVERFLSLLIDVYQGKWPFWLNPYQAMILPINTNEEAQVQAAEAIKRRLRGETWTVDSNDADSDVVPVPLNNFSFNVDIDQRSEPLGYRIKDAILKHYSYLIIVGKDEVASGKYSVRTRDSRDLEHLTSDEIYEKFCSLERNYQ